jgi:hypothetical protein
MRTEGIPGLELILGCSCLARHETKDWATAMGFEQLFAASFSLLFKELKRYRRISLNQ